MYYLYLVGHIYYLCILILSIKNIITKNTLLNIIP